jgi:hypothetical protein
MNVIGLSVLTDYCRANPDAAASLGALVALFQAADSISGEDLLRMVQAISDEAAGGRRRIDLRDARLRIEFAFNEALGLVRILSVARMGTEGVRL